MATLPVFRSNLTMAQTKAFCANVRAQHSKMEALVRWEVLTGSWIYIELSGYRTIDPARKTAMSTPLSQ
jgi:hypothetical protein